MPRLFPSNAELCVPLIIGDGKSDVSSRIGGSPPVGILPRNAISITKYFATIQISDTPIVELSIFLSFTFDEMIDNAGLMHSSERLVQVILHSESVRSATSTIVSDLSPHPIIHGRISEDWLSDDAGIRIIKSQHKLGGRPYIQNFEEGLFTDMEQAIKEGYFQVVQIDFPGADDGDIDGDWPFADGMFHILGKEPLEDCSWRYFWEY